MQINKNKLFFVAVFILFFISLYGFVKINNTWKYSSLIDKYARQYKVDSLLIKALIKVESDFVPDAVSNKGAMGLMQIMPATGSQIADYLHIKNFKKEMLLNPEINIMFGVFYYKILDTRFQGNMNLILASYNAGLGNVAQWRQINPIVDYDFEQMPFKETKQYVKKIAKIYSVLRYIEKIKKTVFFRN